MEKEYTFNSTNAVFWEWPILVNTIFFWGFGAFIIYEGYTNNPQNIPMFIIYILALFFIYEAAGIKYLYYRWLMFKNSRHTILVIDTILQTYTYTHNEETITFSPADIDKWWKYDCGPGLSKDVGVLEFRLKNEKKIVISSGLGNAVDFIYYHRKELGLPEEYRADGQYARFQSFKEYIKEIE